MLTKEQISERVNYIGASECAAVLGLSRWSSPLKVWAEKTGQIEIEDKSDNLAIEVGNELEDAVCRIFSKRTGKKVHRVTETVFHKDYPFIAVNLDRRIVGEDAFLEAKTASGWKAKEWAGEEIPREYLLQVMHGLAVTGKRRAYLACLIGGNQEFEMKTVERDEDLIADIIKREVAFWHEYVEPKIMPVTMTANDGDTLFKLFPQDSGEDVVLDDDTAKIIESRQAMLKDMALIKSNLEKADNDIKARLKNATTATCGAFKVSWKTQHQQAYEVKAMSKRVLRISEIKQEGK